MAFDLNKNSEQQKRIDDLAKTLRTGGFATSDSQARRMAEDMIKVENRVQQRYEHLNEQHMGKVRGYKEFQEKKAEEPVQTPRIQELKSERLPTRTPEQQKAYQHNIDILRRAAQGKDEISISTNYEIPNNKPLREVVKDAEPEITSEEAPEQPESVVSEPILQSSSQKTSDKMPELTTQAAPEPKLQTSPQVMPQPMAQAETPASAESIPVDTPEKIVEVESEQPVPVKHEPAEYTVPEVPNVSSMHQYAESEESTELQPETEESASDVSEESSEPIRTVDEDLPELDLPDNDADLEVSSEDVPDSEPSAEQITPDPDESELFKEPFQEEEALKPDAQKKEKSEESKDDIENQVDISEIFNFGAR